MRLREEPQEAGTVKLLSRRGAGILLKKPTDIVPTLQTLVGNPRRYNELKAATAGMALPGSRDMIIREIAALLPRNSHRPDTPVAAASA